MGFRAWSVGHLGFSRVHRLFRGFVGWSGVDGVVFFAIESSRKV